MGRYLRIELLAILMLAVMLGVSYLIKVKNDKMRENLFAKELEVFHSLTIEANATGVKSRLYTDYTVKEHDVMKMEGITYIGKSAKELKSKYGKNIGDLFYLDEDITLLQDNGYYYEADHAIYDKKNEIFSTTSPFVAYIHGGNIIHGVNLHYDIDKRVAVAKNVDAVLFTKD